MEKTRLLYKANKKTKRKINWFFIVIMVFLTAYAVSLFLPLFWGLINSFKTAFDFDTNRLGFPKPFTLENYQNSLKLLYVPVQDGLGQRNVLVPELFLNSILYALGSAFLQTLACCFVAYVTQKFPWKLCKVIYGIVIVTMILPIIGAMPSEIRILKTLGIYDTIWGAWALKSNFLGIYFLVFHAMFKGVPKALPEAAEIDGAGHFTVLFRIMMPMVIKTFATIMLIYFVQYWNDYQVPLVYIPSHPTLTYAMYKAALSTRISSVPGRLAVCLVVFIPIFLVFIAFHKRLMGNVSMGSVKG